MVSEVRRPRPDPAVARRLGATPPEAIRLSAITLGEIERGVSLLDIGPWRAVVESFLREAKRDMADHVLPVNETVASQWGRLSARHRQQIIRLSVADELIAATALAHNLTFVTRNTRDFARSGVRLLDPWQA